MPLEFNGNSPQTITFNGNQVDYVYYNGTKVWPSTFKVTYSGLNGNYNYFTVNGNTIFGSGNISIEAGSTLIFYAKGQNGYSTYQGSSYIYLDDLIVKRGSGNTQISYSYTPSGPISVRGVKSTSSTTGATTSYIYITT